MKSEKKVTASVFLRMKKSTQTVATNSSNAKNQLIRDLINSPSDISTSTNPTTKPGISSKAKKLRASFHESNEPETVLA